MIDPRLESALAGAERDGRLTASARACITHWLTDEWYRAHREEIAELITRGAFEDLQDAFTGAIPFGTGGRRGAMGPGPNRINARTIAESTQGLSLYVLRAANGRKSPASGDASPPSIVIAYDTRRNSRAFADVAAEVVAGNGLRALIFEGPRSTPELSFAVRKLKAWAGIVISASHNPPQDNGFKAYWTDGAQVVPPHDMAIIGEVKRVTSIPRLPRAEAEAQGLYREIGEEIDRAYIRYAAGCTLAQQRAIGIVFTPLHGTGRTSVAPALAEAGFTDLTHVEEQWSPDPDFRGVPGASPNPENPPALEAAVGQARETGADLALASDPDADRLGVVARHGADWRFLTGNQIGVILFEHIARSLAKAGRLPVGSVLMKTCVTSDLLDRIAEEHGIAVQGDFLVGFKYIAEAIAALSDPGRFLFGIEESHGYLRAPEVRDKDAAQAAVLLAERAAELKASGHTLVDALEEIWARYGYYHELTRSIPLQGAGGGALGVRMMEALRENPPRTIAGEAILAVSDRKSGLVIDLASGKEVGRAPGIPGNLLIFHLEEGGAERISVRPSGTEPKVKIYIQIRGKGPLERQAESSARVMVQARAERLAADFASLMGRS